MKNSKHEVRKAFLESLKEKEDYINLDSTPVGMLPAIKGISDVPSIKIMTSARNSNMQKEVFTKAAEKGTAIGYENDPSVFKLEC